MPTKDKDVEDQTAEELEKTIAATAAADPEPEPEPEPVAAKPGFEYTAGDGTVYKADSSEELFKKVTDALNHSKIAIKDREHQIHDLRTKPTKEEPAKTEPAYDHAAYLRLLETDGVAAQDYVDAFRPQVRETAAERERNAEVKRVQDQVLRFYADVPDYTKIETPELNTAIRERLQAKGRGYTAEGLTATYYELKAEGKIPEGKGRPVSERKAMPGSPGGGSTTSEAEPDYDTMSAKDLKAYMKKNGVPGAEYLQ